jgi:hypothetical protein
VNVVYKKTMLGKIAEARAEAKIKNREIEKIVLTVAEARKVLNEIGPSWVYQREPSPAWTFEEWLTTAEQNPHCAGPQPLCQIMGIRIEVSR